MKEKETLAAVMGLIFIFSLAFIIYNLNVLDDNITALEQQNAQLSEQQSNQLYAFGLEAFKHTEPANKINCISLRLKFTSGSNYMSCKNSTDIIYNITYQNASIENGELRLMVSTYLYGANESFQEFKCETDFNTDGLYDFAKCVEQNKTATAI